MNHYSSSRALIPINSDTVIPSLSFSLSAQVTFHSQQEESKGSRQPEEGRNPKRQQPITLLFGGWLDFGGWMMTRPVFRGWFGFPLWRGRPRRLALDRVAPFFVVPSTYSFAGTLGAIN